MSIIGSTVTSVVAKIAIIIALVASIACVALYKKNTSLTQEVSVKTADIKSLTYGTASFKNDANKWQSISVEYSKSIANLKQDKDSLNQAYLKTLKQLKIKPNDVTMVGGITTKLVHDTTVLFVPTKRDTTYNLSSEPWISEYITIKGDSALSRDLKVKNKQNLVWHTKKETIDPPKSFFLLRWFQKKHYVTYVDIVNENPFIQTTNQDFQIITK